MLISALRVTGRPALGAGICRAALAGQPVMLAGALALVPVISASPALAQVPGGISVQPASPQNATVQQGVAVPTVSGPAQRTINVSVSATATYDNNATRSNSQRQQGSNLSKHDFTFPLLMNVNLVLPYGRNVFSLAGHAGYEFNLHNTIYNNETIGLNGGYQRNFHPCDLSLDGGYFRDRTQRNNTSLIAFQKNIETIASLGGTLSCGGVVGLRPFASVSYSRARNTLTQLIFNDHNSVTYGGGIVYSQPTIGDVGIIGSIDQTTFPNRPVGGVNGSHEIKAKSLGLYFNRTTARILQARVQVNYTTVDDNAPGSGFSGVSGQADVRFMPGGRIQFEANLSRAATAALGYNSDYHVDTQGGLAALGDLIGGRLGWSLRLAKRHRKYYGSMFNPVHPLTSDTQSSITYNANYTLTPRVGLLFGAIYEQRRANDSFYDYNGFRVSVGVDVRI